MDLNPYLTFNGNARDALEFYAKVLGGEVSDVLTFGEMPDDSPVPDELNDRLAHGRVRFGDRAIMASDSWLPEHFKPFQGISIQTGWDDVEKARSVFEALSEGGQITMPFEETFWAKGFGSCVDKFGVSWMINCDNPA